LPGKDGFPGAAPEDVAIAPGLYDLRRDPAERYDVSAANPGIVGDLTALAEAARDDLGDDLTGKKGKNVRSN
jgi:arylsulfatase